MINTIVVGDIHGHVDSVEAALAFPGRVVFVGDYLDSFNQTPDDQATCLRMVLDAIDAEPHRVSGLLGNHEWSYLDADKRCSGWNPNTQALVDAIGKQRILDTLKPYEWVGDYLVTHAGVDHAILEARGETFSEYLINGDFHQIGPVRGGYDEAGGLYWNDFNFEGDPIPGIKQVCGHSNSNRAHPDVAGVRVKYTKCGTGELWCVDNLCRVDDVLLINDDECAIEWSLSEPLQEYI